MAGGAGSSASAIQAQIDAATDGDSILVPPGVYIGTINISGKNITVASEQGPLVTVIDGNRLDSVVTINSNSSTLEGFTIQNGRHVTVGGGGIDVGGSAPTILNNIVANNRSRGIELAFTSAVVRQNTIRNNIGGGIWIRGAGSAVVIDNYILNNSGPSSSLDAGGISMNAAGTPTIQDNTISGNTGGAISMGNSSNALILQNIISNNSGVNCGGIEWLVPSGNDGPRVINNTIVYNDGGQGSAICADGFDAQTLLINNIIAAKAGQTAIYCGDFNNLDPPIIEFNNVYSSSGLGYGGICTDQTGINGNVFGDPLFVDIANEEYQLRATSPSIDAGDNTVPDIPALDIIGNTRFIDGDQNGSTIVDMGAYEHIP
jgi:parallel beta-helix repeat protein